MDPVSTVITVINLVSKITKICSQVQQNREKCEELGNRVQRLLPIIRPLESKSREELEEDITTETLYHLFNLLTKIELFMSKFVDPKKSNVFRAMISFGLEAKDRKEIEKSFINFKTNLDEAIWDFTAMGTERTARLLQEQQRVVVDGLETLYCEDPPKEHSDDERCSLGEGMFGETIRMKNSGDNGLYAVKKIKVAKAKAHGVTIDMMKKECALLHKLSHPHITRYFVSYFSKHGRYFNIVMELIEGGSLVEKVHATPAPSVDAITEWARQMASALAYMHSEHILHRDLKLDNILLTSLSKIKIIDLGFACVAATMAANATKVGAPLYASYEKTNGIPYDGRDDVWAVGCILLELLTRSRLSDNDGGPIFHPEDTSVSARRQQLLQAAAAVSSELGGVVLPQILRPLQADRLTSAQLVAALGPSIPAAPVSPVPIPGLDRALSRSIVSDNQEVAPEHDILCETECISERASSLNTPTETPTIPTLVQLLHSNEPSIIENALQEIINTNIGTEVQNELVAADGVPILVALLKHNNSAIQELSAKIIRRLAINIDYKKYIVAKGAVPPLIHLLSHGTDSSKEHSVGALRLLAVDTVNKTTIADAGVIPLLVELLSTGSDKIKEHVAGTIRNLAVNPEIKIRLTAAGVALPLVQLLSTGTNFAKEQTASAIRNIAVNAENKKILAAAGAIPALVRLLTHESDSTKEQSARALWNLAVDRDNGNILGNEGGIRLLIELCHNKPMSLIEGAMGVLWVLTPNEKFHQFFVDANAVSVFVSLLRDGSDLVQEKAAKCLWNLALHNAALEEMVSIGALPLLVLLLSRDVEAVRNAAAGAIFQIASKGPQLQIAVSDAGAVAPLTAMLHIPTEDSLEISLGALGDIVRANQNKHYFVSSGTIPVLIKLLNSDNNSVKLCAESMLESLASTKADGSFMASASSAEIMKLFIQLYGNIDTATTTAELQIIEDILECWAVHATSGSQAVGNRGISLLLRLMQCSSPTAIETATRAAYHLATEGVYEKALVSAGIIKALLYVLSSGTDTTKEIAVVILSVISENNENHSAIVEEGAVSCLLTLLSTHSATSVVVQTSAVILRCLAENPAYHSVMEASGAVTALAQL